MSQPLQKCKSHSLENFRSHSRENLVSQAQENILSQPWAKLFSWVNIGTICCPNAIAQHWYFFFSKKTEPCPNKQETFSRNCLNTINIATWEFILNKISSLCQTIGVSQRSETRTKRTANYYSRSYWVWYLDPIQLFRILNQIVYRI